ncbi:MAG: 16S rRNA (cytosine(1402)-N(4))-methyltransferase RsmH [Gammaproteobacteria bacterium]|jgi:16S rRNA (cytosine1402-N4)-methyltransferase
MSHIPVLLEESVDLLIQNPSGTYIDGTFGRGGHSARILSKLNKKGRLIAFDKDLDAVNFATSNFKDTRFSIFHGTLNQRHLSKSIEKIEGILFDFGLCSTQLDIAERGFSFNKDGPLDMRMDQSSAMSAREWLANASEKEISSVLWEYGEEKHANSIARLIFHEQQKNPITTTLKLAQLIENHFPRKGKKHPATKCFQAIRIFINNELSDLSENLKTADSLLTSGGRIVTISFHSLEDRKVKEYFKPERSNMHKDIPINPTVNKKYLCIANKIKPRIEEIRSNVRSRSAIMRAYEKV